MDIKEGGPGPLPPRPEGEEPGQPAWLKFEVKLPENPERLAVEYVDKKEKLDSGKGTYADFREYLALGTKFYTDLVRDSRRAMVESGEVRRINVDTREALVFQAARDGDQEAQVKFCKYEARKAEETVEERKAFLEMDREEGKQPEEMDRRAVIRFRRTAASWYRMAATILELEPPTSSPTAV